MGTDLAHIIGWGIYQSSWLLHTVEGMEPLIWSLYDHMNFRIRFSSHSLKRENIFESLTHLHVCE